MMQIPTFVQAQKAVREGNPNPLDYYIYNYEVTGFANTHWRLEFKQMIDYVIAQVEKRSIVPTIKQSNTKARKKSKRPADADLPDTYENY